MAYRGGPVGGDPGDHSSLAAGAQPAPHRPRDGVVASGAKQIERWLETDRLQLTRIPELLAGRGCEVSYTTLRRFIRRRGWTRIAFVRAGL